MPDFLATLAARALGVRPSVQPLARPVFARPSAADLARSGGMMTDRAFGREALRDEIVAAGQSEFAASHEASQSAASLAPEVQVSVPGLAATGRAARPYRTVPAAALSTPPPGADEVARFLQPHTTSPPDIKTALQPRQAVVSPWSGHDVHEQASAQVRPQLTQPLEASPPITPQVAPQQAQITATAAEHAQKQMAQPPARPPAAPSTAAPVVSLHPKPTALPDDEGSPRTVARRGTAGNPLAPPSPATPIRPLVSSQVTGAETNAANLRASSPSAAAPTIKVTIGRVEVRALPSPSNPDIIKRRPRPGPRLTLEEYLRQRKGR